MAAGGDDANGDCGAGGNEFGGAGGEGGGGCTPHLELTEIWGMSNRENIGFTSLGTTSFTTTPDPLVQLRELWRGFSSAPPPCTALPPPTNTNPHYQAKPWWM